ncbi:N-acyl amino acid synthase FeeM domain-containing protein [Pseudoduganella violaceinigra]|uniref:N-acyl amino acid synthase FeeM domain-containing protein n=1 Tax=Pseudoduganella violaceinigra TaxID=246602 RepID=UPI0004035A62|nr:N-acetyltransferase [Pseudoduganella violaceinigra]
MQNSPDTTSTAAADLPVEDAAAHPTVSEGDPLIALLPDQVTQELNFGIRLVDTPTGRNQASMLIHRMYSWRGFSGNHALTPVANRVTLMASQHGETVGTLSVGLDCPEGLLADELFKPQLDECRSRGGKICEIIKFAFDVAGSSKQYQAALFHLAVITARDLHQRTHMFIEVQPRHGGFFENALGFQQIGDPVINPRVNYPGILMSVEIAYMTEQIQRFGGKGAVPGVRSYYPHFFSPREEEGIVNRMLNLPK